jgi:hypothetical protein
VADFNCYNQFIFGRQAMQTLANSGYIPEELFSQKGSMAEDATQSLTKPQWQIYLDKPDSQ